MTIKNLGLHSAIAAGLDYILSRQAGDGSWTDWTLPPGDSTPWTTAYIGLKLGSLPEGLSGQPAPHLAAAARWLGEHIFPDGGWGYNTLVGSDADSTAHAILFLAWARCHLPRAESTRGSAATRFPAAKELHCGLGRPLPGVAYARLAAFQNKDGGFATYQREGPPHSWNASHPDVTPVALRALLTHPALYHDTVRRGIDYVLRQQTASGLWHSFWWDTSLYATEANLALLDALGLQAPAPPALAEIEPANAFETALLLSSLIYAGGRGMDDKERGLAEQLMAGQQPDGSWESAPMLRITRRDCYEPWDSNDAGPLYADPNRLFTTATVLHALAREKDQHGDTEASQRTRRY